MKQNTKMRIVIAVFVFIFGFASIGVSIILLPLFILSGLLILPATSGYVSQTLKMSSEVKIALCVILFLSGFIGMAVLSEKQTNTSTQSTEQRIEEKKEKPKEEDENEEGITIIAESLTVSYEENEVAADKIYKGKVFGVNGFVESIGKDIFDEPYLIIKGHDHVYNVQCYFKSESGLEALYKGQKIEIYGRCDGKTLLNVIMKDCSITRN
ncbi:hypothetical protein QQ054_38445 [Oscillatoria amoena NRMC-F 0135]|nr:hypothetical protein [Oscillatoria amoena NRMC-F 0135]